MWGEERLLRRSLSAPGDEQVEGVRCQVVESGPMTDEAQGVATVRGRKQLDAMPAKWQGKIHVRLAGRWEGEELTWELGVHNRLKTQESRVGIFGYKQINRISVRFS
jgi:hypothetical protein